MPRLLFLVTVVSWKEGMGGRDGWHRRRLLIDDQLPLLLSGFSDSTLLASVSDHSSSLLLSNLDRIRDLKHWNCSGTRPPRTLLK